MNNDKNTSIDNEEHIPGKCRCDLCVTSTQALGSLTGWLLNTRVLSEDKFESKSSFCPNCNKKIDIPNVGSLTQWIFKHEMCRCNQTVEQSKIETFDESIKLEEIESIDVPEGFPKNRFNPVARVAAGSSGTIYKAVDIVLNKTVAIKILKVINNKQFIAFQREAKAISLLNHPNIVKVFDFSLGDADTPYMVEEFIDGVSLANLIGSNSLDRKKILKIFDQIADAICHAHRQGILHRDLKP